MTVMYDVGIYEIMNLIPSMKGELISSWEKIFYFCRSNNESKNEYYISMGRFRFNYLRKPVYVGDKKNVNNELEMVYGRSI